jgi:PAS domain S-box-containing protein
VIEDDLNAIYNILLLDRDGRHIVNTLAPPGTEQPPLGAIGGARFGAADGTHFGPAEAVAHVVETGQVFVTDLVWGPVAQRPIVAVIRPVFRDGAVVGVLGATLLPQHFGEILRALMPERGYVAALVDRAGYIVARTQDEERFVGTRATEDVQSFVAAFPLAADDRVATTADGEPVHAAFRRLSVVPWTIAYAASRNVLDAPLRRLVLILASAGTLATAFFVVAFLSLGRNLAGEMRSLARDAAAIGRGRRLPHREDRVREVAEVRAALRDGVASLAAAEERMRLAIEGAGLAMWEIDEARDEITWSGHFPAIMGLPSDTAQPMPLGAWKDRVHPEDLPTLIEAWQRARRDGQRFHCIYRVLHDDGGLRWLETFGRHLAGTGRLIGVTLDITERRKAEEERRLLMREVDHRAKNALAVVHSVVRLTKASDPALYAAAVEGRVRALARAHDLLARDRWSGASLMDLAAEELAAHVANGQVTFGGPPVRIAPGAVQPLSMVLHELATNAARYGALSRVGGQIAVTWWLEDGDGPFRVRWTERGGPPITAPAEAGFGSRLIDVTIRGQLGGSARFDWQAEGLVCDLEIARIWTSELQGDGDAPDARRSPRDAGHPALDGCRVLIVEDEPLIGTDLADCLSRHGGGVVGPFERLAEAEAALEEAGRIDAAILDVDLGGVSALPLARALAACGIPVLVVTGYHDLPSGWSEIVARDRILQKPAAPEAICDAIAGILRRRRSR